MRYINVTLIDTTGAPTTTQIRTPRTETWGPAIDWMEEKMFQAASRHSMHHTFYIACFMYDTRSEELVRYDIEGNVARIR